MIQQGRETVQQDAGGEEADECIQREQERHEGARRRNPLMQHAHGEAYAMRGRAGFSSGESRRFKRICEQELRSSYQVQSMEDEV